MKDLSRRDFLKTLGVGAVGFVAQSKLAFAGKNRFLALDDPSRVVQCYDDNATNGSTINEPTVQVMVDESIKALTGLPTVGEAYKSLFPGITTASVVGIKVNAINSALPTHKQVANCIINGLAQMDIGGTFFKKNNAIVWDRSNSELTSSGYTKYTGSDPATPRCYGTNESGVGYDTSKPLNVGGITSNPSKIMSQTCEFIIDAAVLKTHSGGVVTLGLKNHYGSVHNPSSLSHSNACTPSVPALNAQIRDVLTPTNKQRLFIIDGLFGLYSGGPGGSPNFNPKVIIMSLDPVACDFQGQNVINIERQRRSLTPVNCGHITMAAQAPYNLGTTDIELIEINNPTAVKEQNPVQPGRGLVVTPEPVRDQAVVSFSLARPGRVELDIVNSAGRTEQRLFAGTLGRGRHQVNYRRNGLRAGTYVLRLRGAGADATRKVTVVR